MNQNRRLEAAISYAKRGWRVLPLHGVRRGECTCGDPNCTSPGKHPRLPNWPKNATTDGAVIRPWWRKCPSANIGIATGEGSGFFVLDVDGPEGEKALKDLEAKNGPLPLTLQQLTGKGRHLLFRHPGKPIKNRARLRPGLDVRGDGGYIVAPPSVHASGRRYRWAEDSPLEPAPPPEWLVKILSNGSDGRPQDAGRVEGDQAEKGEILTEGTRNDGLTRVAGRYFAKGLAPEEVEVLLLRWNETYCRPPLEQEEVLRIVRSIGRREHQKSPDDLSLMRLTDIANGARLVEQHGQDMRYCHPWGKWLVWDGSRWKVDDQGVATRWAKDTASRISREALAEQDGKKRRELMKHAKASMAAPRIKAMLEMAASEQGIPVLPSELDKSQWLLNCRNGTIDLRTGKISPHTREHLITKIAPASYDPEAPANRWVTFLYEIMGGNENLVRFLQRAVGMSITGDTSEHVLFILYGTGRNGKSTFLNTILELLGDYAIQAPPNLLMKKSESHPTELADLFGKRMVVAMESAEGQRLSESLVKHLTGGDKIKARRMREDFWEFWPTHKLWLATNHKPEVRGTDVAIWSRLKLIPFNESFAGREDKDLQRKLREEFPGILRWAVEGCLEWQRDGLGIPEEVAQATAAYRSEQDVLATFLEECCVESKLACAPAGDLYAAYCAWGEANRERVVSQTRFGRQLRERGFTKERRERGIVWLGIGLRDHGGERVWRHTQGCMVAV